MDAITLATAVVNLLVPYLPQIAEAASKAVVDKALEKLKLIFTTVKEKFAGNVYAEETLKRVEEQPQSQSRQAALIGVLEEQIQGDPDFTDTLRKLIDESNNSGSEIINQKVTISGHARTGDVTTLGKVEGSVDMSKKK